MEQLLIAKALVAFAPALLLLLVFDRLDVFNLITVRNIITLLIVGGGLAALSFVANLRVMDGFPIGFSAYSRYVAPLIEETLKATPILALYLFNRIGFKLDAVLVGFAIGAGFATVENFWYMFLLPEANLSAWIVRGFGTAVMHSGATALFAVISHEMTERQSEGQAAAYRFNPLLFIPGLGAAIVIHSAFNHFPHQPILAMAATMLLIPTTLFLALSRSDRATQNWLRRDQEAHRQLLTEIRSGHFPRSLRAGASEEIAQYAELKVELVLRAEELILASQTAESSAELTQEDREKLARLSGMEGRIGASAIAAVNAQLGLSRNDLWELGRLRNRAKKAQN